MGIWDYISSTTDSIKRSVPDLSSPVTGLYRSSCDYTHAAVTNIRKVVMDNAVVDQLYRDLPDAERRSKIAANLAKNTAAVAVQEGVKSVPGGSIAYTIVSRSLRSDNKNKDHEEDLKELKDKVDRMEKELGDYRKLLEQTGIRKPSMELKSKSTLDLDQKPEDVIKIFCW